MTGKSQFRSRRHPGFCMTASLLSGLSIAVPNMADSQVQVVATIKPLHSLVSAVMGDAGEPFLLVENAVSSHSFTIRPSDARKLESADVVFMIAHEVETSLVEPIQSLASEAVVVELALVDGLTRRPFRMGGEFEIDHDHHHGELEAEDDHAGHDGHDDGHDDHDGHDDEHAGHDEEHDDHDFDMHVWLDPINAIVMSHAIAATLSEVDPDNAAVYRTNANALQPRLEELSEEISVELSSAREIPFLVFHDGYRYFEDRYGLNIVGSAVLNHARPPGVRRVRELQAKMVDLGTRCVFSEPQFNERIVQVIIEGTPVRVGFLDPLGTDIEPGPDLYPKVLQNMAKAYKDCLAPE